MERDAQQRVGCEMYVRGLGDEDGLIIALVIIRRWEDERSRCMCILLIDTKTRAGGFYLNVKAKNFF